MTALGMSSDLAKLQLTACEKKTCCLPEANAATLCRRVHLIQVGLVQ